MRMWAFWRRLYYALGMFVFLALVSYGGYRTYVYEAPTCFDGFQNGLEGGIDCGGGCTRICSADVREPHVRWVRAFRVTDGLYNAVAYVENRNTNAGVERLEYTMRFFDAEGLITEKKGYTELPPNELYPIFEGRIETGTRVPTQSIIEFDSDPLWVNAKMSDPVFSTVRRELSGVDARPKLSAVIENKSLGEAENVDIVATIFDREGTALTASRTQVPRFPPRSEREVSFTWQEPIAKTIRSCIAPADVAMLTDLSGSMNDDGGDPPEPVTSVLRAAASFVDRLTNNDQVSVVTYATDARVESVLSSDHASIQGVIRALTILPESERGSTNTGDALMKAREELTSSRHQEDSRRVAILLTDGLATAPKKDPEVYAKEQAKLLTESGIELYTIGLGTKLNEAFLKEISSSETHSFTAPTTQMLDQIYTTISAALCEEGVAVIEIIPKRKGIFEQITPQP